MSEHASFKSRSSGFQQLWQNDSAQVIPITALLILVIL